MQAQNRSERRIIIYFSALLPKYGSTSKVLAKEEKASKENGRYEEAANHFNFQNRYNLDESFQPSRMFLRSGTNCKICERFFPFAL